MAKKGVSVGVEITGTSKGFKSASEDAQKATAALKKKASSDSKGIATAFQSMGGAIGRTVRGVSDAFKVLLANPVAIALTAIVGAMGALVKAFKSTDKGGTEFAARFEQIKAVIDVVRQRVISVADGIGHIFKGEWKEAGQSFKEAITGIGDQLRDATKAAYEYQQALDRIGDSESNYASVSAENRNKIARLEYIAQDRSKSAGQRKRALQEAIRIGEEESKRQVDFARQKLDAELEYLAGRNDIRKEDLLSFIKMTDAEQANASAAMINIRNNYEAKFEEIEKLYASMIDADTRFFEENKRNISRLTGFEQEEIRKREAALIKIKQEYADIYRIATSIPTFASLGKKSTQPVQGAGLLPGGRTLAGTSNEIQFVNPEQLNQLKSIGEYLSDASLKTALLTDAFGLLGETIEGVTSGAKGSIKGMITAALQGIRQVINAYLAEAIAATIAKNAKLPFGLIAASVGVAALTGFWKAKVPAFASGTDFAPGGLSLVGERGPELVNLPRGSQVIPMKKQSHDLNLGLKANIAGSTIRLVLDRADREKLIIT